MDKKKNEVVLAIAEILARHFDEAHTPSGDKKPNTFIFIVESFNGARPHEGLFDRIIAGIEGRVFKIAICISLIVSILGFLSYKSGYPLSSGIGQATASEDTQLKQGGDGARMKAEPKKVSRNVLPQSKDQK